MFLFSFRCVFRFVFVGLGGPGGVFGGLGVVFLVPVAVVACHYFCQF